MSMMDDIGHESDNSAAWLSDLPPTKFQTWSAVTVAAVGLVAFIAIAPFSGIPLAALNIFFPLLDAIVFVTDLVTAVLLFSQFAISGSRPLLVLANGYLFTGLIVVPHALTFTGAFSPTGLLGANIQTGSWLFIFWHIGFSAALLTYALLTIKTRAPILPERALSTICWSVASVVALTCGLTWLSTAGAHLLPPIIVDANRLSPLVIYPIWLTILISALAFSVLTFRQRSVLDQWLMVVALICIGELAFSGLLPGVRFSLGFYAGRVFSIVAASIVLIILLAETTRLYVLLARSHAKLRREQDSKLMDFEAIVAAISHEVKQPLGTIELNSDTAQRILDEPTLGDVGEAHAVIGEIREAARRITETLDGFRSLFGRIDQKRQPVNLNEVILDVLKSSRAELSAHGVVARTKLKTELPIIYGNGNQLHQLIYNLVHNAIEAMSETTSRDKMLEVTTSIWDRNAIVIEVSDNGPGIDPQKLGEIFEAFVTTKPHGMGLGLAICRRIVERHEGRISASSVKPHGTNFRIQLSPGGPIR